MCAAVQGVCAAVQGVCAAVQSVCAAVHRSVRPYTPLVSPNEVFALHTKEI